MQNSRIGRRLGFILSTIHTGSALKLFHRFVERAVQDEGSVFVFPGGKLDAKSDTEHLRNDIYKIVNSANLDGLVSWASSISGSVPLQQVEEFHDQFKSIPFVTIGQKVSGHPCAEFDAHSGMKELVRHFVQVHDLKKIAFLRGPDTHTSAEERFHGYKDALTEVGINDFDNLVSSPFGFDDGEAAVIQLCEERGLVPGKDFDAIVAASDLMASAAVTYLKKKGVQIPKELKVGGFNDTSESRVSVPPFSTVHMPRTELAIESYEKLANVLDGMLGVSDTNIPAYPIFRESCGCGQVKIWASDLKIKIKTEAQFKEEIYRIFRVNPLTGKFDPVIRALFDTDKSKFYEMFTQLLTAYFDNNGELQNLFTAMSLFRNITCLPPEYIEKIIRHVTVLIPRVQEKVFASKRYQAEKMNAAISSLENELLSVFDRENLITVLKKKLGKIGVNVLAIVLYYDETYSTYIGGFNADNEVRVEDVRFSRESIVPERFSGDFNNGAFLVQPLFVEGRSYGYIICNYSGCPGLIYEDLRSSVSSTLQSIFLFEQTNEAKRIAEQAEFAKTEFFANVGSDLCDPLKNISAKITQMEENIDKGILDKDILSEQLLFLRSQIDAQLEKTETLVDLTRSQVDDLPMDKKLFDIHQILPSSVSAGITKNFPLLYGDAERLKRALQTIFEFSEKIPCITEKQEGVHIEFYSNKFDWQKPELLLAEKIILLQYGEVVKSVNYAEVVLPWPNLAGQPLESMNGGDYVIYCFSENLPAEKKDAKTKYIFDEDVNIAEVKKAILLWEPDSAPIDEWVKVYGLRHYDALFRAPILCYSHNMIGHNFIELLEQKIKAQRSAPVLFVNTKHTHYGTWATDANSVSISSMQEFDKILDEITPSLIVFESIDEASIRKIRQNQKTVLVPIIVLPDTVEREEDIELLCSHPRIILCNRGAAESEQFDERIKGILAGDEILPPHTGALVKKAILYLNKNASQQIVRWKLADTVHVSEDYLTRIFHKEIGLSLWEYLNRYRIYIATKMLLETNDTIYEIAENSGFQDQAYFCRVFKKIYGVPPGKIRSK